MIHEQNIKAIGDVLSVTTVVATLAAWLPPVAALFTIVWTLIRIWETKTVQGWITKRKNNARSSDEG